MYLMRLIMRIIGFVALLGLIIGFVWFVFIREDTPTPILEGTVKAPIQTDGKSYDDASDISLVIGNTDAPITITKYGDFLCPICKQFFETTEPRLLTKYVDTGKAKIIFKVDTHIAEQSQYAGEGAYCAAEQDKFRDYHNFVYRIQGEYAGYNFDQFKTLIRNQLELDRNNFDACMDGHRYRARVEADHAESGRVGGHTTPTFIIGEHKISGAQPLSIFDAVLRTVP
jgi:protein-disulfide isomerase